jgi:limonene-1,2-epoxide hydrolase
MTPEEQRNLKVAALYEELYNNDIERFVPECEAYVMGRSVIRGYDEFLEAERTVLKAAPRRRMRVDKAHAVDDTVIVEAVLLNPDEGPNWQLPFCAALICRDGKIAIDRTYAEWPEWPGLL